MANECSVCVCPRTMYKRVTLITAHQRAPAERTHVKYYDYDYYNYVLYMCTGSSTIRARPNSAFHKKRRVYSAAVSPNSRRNNKSTRVICSARSVNICRCMWLAIALFKKKMANFLHTFGTKKYKEETLNLMIFNMNQKLLYSPDPQTFSTHCSFVLFVWRIVCPLLLFCSDIGK